MTRCGFIALIGAPNAGKSCLLNALAGHKISIVSPKVQTTRTRITAIVTEGDRQAVFIDTPGIFRPRRRLDRAMVAAAHDARDGADIVAIVADAAKKDVAGTVNKLAGRLTRDAARRVILVLNKIDLVPRQKLLPLIAQLNTLGFDAVFLVAATRDDGIADLKRYLFDHLPEGPFQYDPDQTSDQPDAILAAEITREKLFLRLHQELPYGLHVETVSFDEQRDGSLRIEQRILVSEPRHKGMVIGKEGTMLGLVGQMARAEMEEIFSARVHLFLDVAVRTGWDEKSDVISGMGLDPRA
ncbi:MAG: GTPase Era [Rhodospirillales bacterium]|nr:GTPase Era [Alphaproteobacteria bacterium]MCB9986854.1 GTPase Era [Rhodospirillales bacterium]USO08384.1 MAG: GTPase Era [Rhodospirillales bacterium]